MMPKISACVITKNEEKNIVNWLKCMKVLADEMVVVDTGSEDRTVEIAKESGALIYKVDWKNDFSYAKNYAIDRATGDWIVFLDADEYFTEKSIDKVKCEIEKIDKEKIDAIICKIVNVNADDNNRYMSSFYNLRIFKNNANLRYENKVHEMLKTKNAEQLRLLKLDNNIEIYHTGYSSSIIKAKLERNLKIMLDEIKKNGEKPWHYGFLCDCYYGLGEYEKTIEYAKKAIASGIKLVGQENNVYMRLISSLVFLEKDEKDILEEINNAICKFPDLPDFYMDKAIILFKQKYYLEAENNFLTVMDKYNNNKSDLLTNTMDGKIYLLYAYLGEISLLKNDISKALEFFIESVLKNKYYEISFLNLYEIIKEQPVEDIISFLNTLYDDSERDLQFLCNALKKKQVDKTYLYYAYQLKKKYDNYEMESTHIINLLNNDKHSNAIKLLKEKLDNNYQMLILNSFLSNNSSDMIDFVLPPKYKTLKNELNKNKNIENIYSGKKFIKEVLGEIMNNKYETSMDKIDEKVSIVIKSCKIKNLEVCMENINKNTDEDYEITIISTEAEYLKKNYSEYNIILLSDNIAESYNQAVNKCNSDWIVFLDDDAIVTPNWLKNMYKITKFDNTGAIGPLTNKVIGQALDFDFSTEIEIDKLASDIERKNNDISKKILALNGACLLLNKKALVKIGGLDSNIENEAIWDDLSCRLITAGYNLLLSCDTFVYFTGEARVRNSYEGFKKKWGFDFFYSNGCRVDLIKIMNLRNNGLNILEVGCACGGTLLEINNINPTVNLYGIEINENSANIAKHIANVSSANIEKGNLPYEQKFFDYVIFGDVLEHLYDPQKALENVKPYLKDTGMIIASIPNVQHWSIIEELLKGNWTYTDAGILDRTHLRFFTKSEITKLFCESGYEVQQYIGKDVGITESAQNMLEKLSQNLLINNSDDFMAYQWLVEACKKDDVSDDDKKELVYLLRRLDNDINKEESLNKTRLFIAEKDFKYKLLIDLIDISLINKIEVLLEISLNMYNNQESKNSIQLLIEGYKKYSDNIEVLCTLAYLLNLNGDKESAIKLLKNTKLKDESINKLLSEFREVQ